MKRHRRHPLYPMIRYNTAEAFYREPGLTVEQTVALAIVFLFGIGLSLLPLLIGGAP